MTTAQFLTRANRLFHRTQSDPEPVSSVSYALARLRQYGEEGEALRNRALDAGL